ncbi:MAG: PfkB family carbohydrate kinase, partial [Bacteroidota bacterium]
MNKVLTFGELLIRIQASSSALIKKYEIAAVEVFAGGSEANVAMGLSYLNVPVAYCTAIPDNPITKSITAVLESSAVDVSKIMWQGSR